MNNAMHLVLDIGNTQMKYGLFANNGLALSGVCTEWTQQSWDTFFRKYPFSVVLIGSVGSSSKQVVNYLPENTRVHYVDNFTKYPFSSNYDNLNTLGIDRRAAISGAISLYPNQPILVVDAGSCITYDYVDASGLHHGGAIAPGRLMRYQALHLCTHGLPLVAPALEIPSLGTSTKTSIQLGVEAGLIAEIKSHIETFTSKFGNFTTILTGGDADFLIKKIKNSIFANADLNLIGLHCILTFNGLHEE